MKYQYLKNTFHIQNVNEILISQLIVVMAYFHCWTQVQIQIPSRIRITVLYNIFRLVRIWTLIP